MKIYISASKNRNLHEAKGWLIDNENGKAMFPEIEAWAIRNEPYWGECYIFIEVSIPQGLNFTSPHNQIDLLIAFSHKIALCELKGYRTENRLDLKTLNNCVEQIEAQDKWITDLLWQVKSFAQLVRQNKRNKPLYQFLLFYGMQPNDVNIVNQRLVDNFSTHQVWVTGANPRLKGQKIGDRPCYLPEALDEKLRKHTVIASFQSQPLQEFIFQQIKKSKGELKSFENFSQLKSYLEAITDELNIQPVEHFIPNLRLNLLNKLTKELEEKRIVELVGTPGIGKSTLATEIINVKKDLVLEVSLQRCDSVVEVCNRIWSNLVGGRLEGLGEESYIQRLLDTPYLFWIRGYDAISGNSLSRFFQIVQSKIDSRSPEQSRWLIESQSPITSLRSFTHFIGALDNVSLSRILDKVESGGAFKNPEEVIDRARGNPERAIQLWQSQNPSYGGNVGEIGWFSRQLTIDEKRILPALCLMISKAPLGVTAKHFNEAAKVFCRDLLESQIRHATESLLKKLEEYQLANITRFEKGLFVGLLDEILPSDASLIIVNHIDPKIVETEMHSITEEKQNKFFNDLQDILFSNSQNTDTLDFITFALNTGDLEPYFRSAFRFTSLRQVLDWIDSTGWEAPNNSQAYLLKALRFLNQMRRKAESEIEDFTEEFSRPDPKDELQCFVYEYVQGRSYVVKKIEDGFDYINWLKEASKCKDDDLRAIKLVSIIYAFHSSERNKVVWLLLKNLPENFKVNSSARALAVYTILEFLNKTTFRKEIGMSEEKAYPLIEAYSREYITDGLRIENIQVICDALYNYSRAQEFRKSWTEFSSVLDYLPVLSYVENAPRTRARQRIKIVLTQGSIYRHFCRNNKLKWNEFLTAFENGMYLYQRAFQAALSESHTMHICNATSYIIELCSMSLRYYNEPDTLDKLAENLEKTIDIVNKLGKNVDKLIRLNNEEIIFSTINQNFPALLYAHLVSKTFIKDDELFYLKERTASSINLLLEKLNNAEEEVNDFLKNKKLEQAKRSIKSVLRNFRRAISYANKRNTIRNMTLFDLLHPHLNDFLSETRWLSRDEIIGGEWSKLSNIVNPK
ncbi:MAG TPA: hypothetical protein VF556_01905 [Pyrinomonadaceae bacterium]|jgi:hypothetical protein